MLGDFADDAILPEIFGDLTKSPFPAIRLSETRFFVADHPMQVTGAFIDRQRTDGWARALESDDSGHTWTTVQFSAPIPPGSVVSLVGRGRLDDRTGELIANPADVVRRLCQIAGRDDDWSDWRAECSGLNLTIAGRIFERKALKLHIDDVTQSSGAIWAAGMARQYPSAVAPATILDLDWHDVSNIRVSASLTDTADVLRLAYDRSDASGRALRYIELSASPQRYGGLSKEVLYPYLRTAQNAESIGRAVLGRLAGERYDVEFDSLVTTIRPGDSVRPVAHPEWPLPGADPVVMVLGADIEPDSNSVHVTGEYTAGQALITVTAYSLALPDTVEAGVAVEVRDGVATFTITDKDGKPLAHARVALDGGPPKSTDAQGKVSFVVTPGQHTLDVEAVGYLPFTLQVTL